MFSMVCMVVCASRSRRGCGGIVGVEYAVLA